MNRSAIAAAVLLVLGGAGVALLQPGLARTAHDLKESGDVYPLPPPAELHLATLGWDAAAVDLLWSNLLVVYGTHWAEHREFLETPKYADAILELEPTYAPLYKFIDTMLVYRPPQGTEKDVRAARAYLERGTRARPEDAVIWMNYGEFIAFIAPSFLHDEAEIARWRKEGAAAMGHGVELGGDADLALTAATLLTEAGQTEAAVRYLEHAYAFTEHPSMAAVHDAIGRRLARLQANEMRQAADTAARTVDEQWQRELPFVSRDLYLMLGPSVDPLRCAGLQGSEDTTCTRDWRPPPAP